MRDDDLGIDASEHVQRFVRSSCNDPTCDMNMRSSLEVTGHELHALLNAIIDHVDFLIEMIEDCEDPTCKRFQAECFQHDLCEECNGYMMQLPASLHAEAKLLKQNSDIYV